MGGETGGCGEGGSEGGGWEGSEGEGDLILTMGERVVFLSVVYGVLDTRFVVFTKYKYISEERRNKNNAPSWTLYHFIICNVSRYNDSEAACSGLNAPTRSENNALNKQTVFGPSVIPHSLSPEAR